MKRILALAAVVMIAASTFAQRVESDYVKDDVRVIKLEEQNLYRRMFSAASIIMECYVGQNNKQVYFLNLALNEDGVEISKDAMLALKFEDGSVMELKSVRDCTYELEAYENHLNKYTYPTYVMTSEQAQKIANGNVIKIRIETTGNYLDYEIKRNKLSKYVASGLSNINACLATGAKNKLSGF